MANLPTLSRGESPSLFRVGQIDPSFRSPDDAGYEHRRRKYTRRPSRTWRTGWIGVSQADKDAIDNFYQIHQTDSAFTYQDYINGGTYNVFFDKPPEYEYTGIGRTRIWTIRIELKEV